jgi:peptide-methionine (S)-S-oxide reductase
VFQRIDGVKSVTCGYAGGTVKHPTYKQICTGKTGHAEVARIVFDPAVLSYRRLLERFWKMHDPTTLNRQGNDVGTQYRSVIFYHDDAQKETAETLKKELGDAGTFAKPIVTEISPAPDFYAAEDYHQDYFDNNRNQPYCRFVILPKLRKLKLDDK